MRFPPEWIQKLKDSISLVDVVSENVELKRSGNTRFMGRCPFHGDRSPSFSVNKDFYYCFGCKKTGDVINFVMEMHGLGFEEACEELAEKTKIAFPKSTTSTAEEQAQYAKRAKIQQAARLNHFAALNFYHQNLKTSTVSPLFQEARDYLSKRGITEQTIDHFQVGVASAQADGLVQFLTQAKAPLDLAREFGLIRPSQKQAGDYDWFRERLLFPLIDVRGRVCGFGGRILPSCDNKELPKYLNSHESDLFSKSRFLYGLFQAKRAIRETETAIVVEGYFDTIALHQSGFDNTVATCGTSLTEEHLKVLSKQAKKIIIFFDQDAAGINATLKAMEAALKLGIVVYGIPFETKLDPDEFLLNGTQDSSEKSAVEKMKEFISKAYPLLDTMIERELKNSEGQVELRTQAIRKITQWLENFSDPVGKSRRVDQLVKKWQIPAQALGSQLGTLVKSMAARAPAPTRYAPNPNAPQNSPQRPVNRPVKRAKLSLLDRDLIQYFVQFESFGAYFQEVRNELPEKDTLFALFDDTEMREWVKRIQADPAGFTKLKMAPESLLDDSISQELRTVILEGLLAEKVEGQEEQITLLLKKANHKVWAQFSQEIRKKMASAEASQDMKSFEELSKQFLDLQKKLKEFEGLYVSGKNP